jgi:hypothetical protein
MTERRCDFCGDTPAYTAVGSGVACFACGLFISITRLRNWQNFLRETRSGAAEAFAAGARPSIAFEVVDET